MVIVMIDEFITKLRERISRGLPGQTAHRRMAPAGRITGPFLADDFMQAKRASVLLLMYPGAGEVEFVMIQRPAYNGAHGGQVSLPGGKIETGDTSPWHAAIRESEEEIGIDSTQIQFAAELSSLYIPVSNFFVYAFLGFISQKPVFIPDAKEVESIIETPVRILLDNSIKGEMDFARGGTVMHVPCYRIQNANVWGATAIILSEVEELLRTM